MVVDSDAGAGAALEESRRLNRPYPVLGLVGGDLCRTLGGGQGPPHEGEVRLRDGKGVRFEVDVGEALIDGRLRLFVAHLVARNRSWTRVFAAMNAQHLGRWNAGPRAHPGDGLLDTYDATLPLSQVVAVRSRLHQGAHLPHPGIKERRTVAHSVDLPRSLGIWVDGEKVGRGRRISVRAEADAMVVVVA